MQVLARRGLWLYSASIGRERKTTFTVAVRGDPKSRRWPGARDANATRRPRRVRGHREGRVIDGCLMQVDECGVTSCPDRKRPYHQMDHNGGGDHSHNHQGGGGGGGPFTKRHFANTHSHNATNTSSSNAFFQRGPPSRCLLPPDSVGMYAHAPLSPSLFLSLPVCVCERSTDTAVVCCLDGLCDQAT